MTTRDSQPPRQRTTFSMDDTLPQGASARDAAQPARQGTSPPPEIQRDEGPLGAGREPAPTFAPNRESETTEEQASARQLREAMNSALLSDEEAARLRRATESNSKFPARPPPSSTGDEPERAAPKPGLAESLDATSRAPHRSRSALMKLVAVRVAQLSLVAALLSVLAVVLVVRHYESNLPSVEQLKAGYDPPQVTRVLARDGTLLANLFTERRTVVPFSEVPNHVKQAFLAAEDASFYEHEGLDYLGMLRAMVANLRAGRTTQGGSTITQQVIKNVLLDSERSYRRKIRETILARRVEQHLSKDEIFGLYLNHIYLGHGRYGVEEASRYYFGKKVKEIDIPEAALLAGLVAAPERFSPRKHPERALERRRYVLGQMLKKGFMTQAVHDQASIVPMKIAPAVEAESELCPEVIPSVRRLLKSVEPDRARRGGYTVHTSIDPALQTAARQALRDNLDSYMKRQKLAPPFTLKSRRLWGKAFTGTPKRHRIYVGTVKEVNDAAGTLDVMVGDTLGRVILKDEERYNPKRLPPSEFAKPDAVLRVTALENPGDTSGPIPLSLALAPEGALVAIDVRTREVRALVGSYDAMMGGLDRTGLNAKPGSLLTKRQPGSAFKPLMYSYALHSRHVTPATVFEFDNKPGSDEPTRRISLREGVASSDNDVAERVLAMVGPANVVEWAKAMGISSQLQADKSLALGSYEVTVFELTNAYATLASGGTYAPPQLISKVIVPDGSELPLPPEPPKRRVMSADVAYLTTSLLRGVVETGTGRRARSLGRPVAGKTGTTNDNRDAWFVGYSTDFVAGSWVGYDDNLPLGWGEYGAVAALPAWLQFMKFAHEGRPRTQFPRPSGIVKARVDPRTGLLPYPHQEDSIEEEFLPDSLPSEVAPVPEPEETADTTSEADADAAAEAPEPATSPGPADRDPDQEQDPTTHVEPPTAPPTTNPDVDEPDPEATPAPLPDSEPPPF